MVNLLDVRSLIFFSMILVLVLIIVMVYCLRTRKTYAGFGLWTLSLVCGSLGLALMAGRDVLPAMASIVLGNLLTLSLPAMALHGMYAFTDRVRPLWPDLVILAVFSGLLLWLTYVQPSIYWRIVAHSFFMVFYLQELVRYIAGPVARLLGARNWLLISTLALVGFFYLMRGILTLTADGQVPSLLAASPLHGLAFVVPTSGLVLIVTGLVFLNSQRLELELSQAQHEVKILGGLLPICAKCKSIRDDGGYWHQVEQYIKDHSQADFTHGICPDCLRELYPEVAEKLLATLEQPQP